MADGAGGDGSGRDPRADRAGLISAAVARRRQRPGQLPALGHRILSRSDLGHPGHYLYLPYVDPDTGELTAVAVAGFDGELRADRSPEQAFPAGGRG